jgi:glycosyltransferase involved in cell wall biosynthesis
MHIIALANSPSSSRGGQELSLFEVCHSLHQRGHHISLLYLKEGDLVERYREFCYHIIAVNAYKVLRKKELSRFISDFLKIPRIKNGVVYSNQYHDCVMGYALALSRNIPLICHLRTPAPTKLEAFDWQLNASLKGVKRFISTSHQTKQDWVRLGFQPSKFEVVHNGTDTDAFKPTDNFSALRQQWQIPETTKVISYVGRLDGIKGIETLIKAFALIVQQGIDARLLIAGKPVSHGDGKAREDYLRSLYQLSADLEVAEQMSFLGHVAHPVSLYQVSDVSVLPSVFPEPFGRSVIESLSCGVPVMGSQIGGIPEILTGAFQNWLFEPGNEVELAAKLTEILHWRKTHPQLSQQCRNHAVQHFSIEQTTRRIEHILLTADKQNASYNS